MDGVYPMLILHPVRTQTPSLIPVDLLAFVINAVRDKFGIAEDAEVSMEVWALHSCLISGQSLCPLAFQCLAAKLSPG